MKLGRLAHACIGAAIVFGGRQGIPAVPLLLWILAAAAVGALWECVLQQRLARIFPWPDAARPNFKDWIAFPIGAGIAAALVAILSVPVPL